MPRSLHFALRAASACLVLSGYWALANVHEYGSLAMLIPVLALLLEPLGEWMDSRLRLYRWFSQGLLVLCLLSIPFALKTLGLLNAVILLVVFVQVFTLLHAKTTANYYHLYLMSFFLLLAACVQEPDSTIAFAMVAFLFSAVWALLVLRMSVESGLQHTEVIAELRPLQGVSGGPTPKRAPIFSLGLFVSVSLVSVMALGFSAVFFVASPRVEAGFMGNNPMREAPVNRQRIDPVALRSIEANKSLIMSVSFPEERGFRVRNEEVLYWRCVTLPKLNNGKWEQAPLSDHFYPETHFISTTWRNRECIVRDDRNDRALHDHWPSILQHIYLNEAQPNGLPALDLAHRVVIFERDFDITPHWAEDNDLAIHINSWDDPTIRYSVDSTISNLNLDTLKNAPNDYSVLPAEDFALLTEHNLTAAAQERALELTRGVEHPAGKAEALMAFFRGADFVYLSPPPAYNMANPLDEFILRGKTGDCQYFASAFTLMMRSLGIPARMVSGYHGGTWDSQSLRYLVEKQMAHAWTEVYFPTVGWVRYDPTPASSDEGLGSVFDLGRFLARLGVRAEILWFQNVVRFDRSRQSEWLRSFRLGLLDEMPGIDMPGSLRIAPRDWREWSLLLAVLLGGGLLANWLGRRFWKRAQKTAWIPTLSPDQRRAVRLYTRLCRHLERLGLPVHGRSAREIEDLLSDRQWLGLTHAREIIRTYESARFGGRAFTKQRYSSLMKNLAQIVPVP